MHSLLVRLLLIVTVALTPGLLLAIDSEIQARRTRQELMDDEARRLVSHVGEEQQRILGGAEQVLTAIGSGAFILDDHPDICWRQMANLIGGSPRYLSAAIIGTDGHFLCAPNGFHPGTDLSDRAFFRLAMQSGQFVVGEYVIGRETGRPTIHLAKPFKRADGKIAGVAVVSLNLNWLAEQFEHLAMPAGAAANVRDRNGILLARYPNAAGAVGQTLPDAMRNTLTGSQIATAVYLGLDGRPRLTAIAPVGTLVNGLRVVVALDLETSFAGVTRANERDLILIAGTFLLALVATALLCSQLIRRPVQRLLDVADRWRAGDLSARTHLRHHAGEFGRLAAAFDAMAEAQQAREAALRVSEAEYRATFEQTSVGMNQCTLDGTIVRVNDAMCLIHGRTPKELLGHRFIEFTHPDDRTTDEKQLAAILAGETSSATNEKRYIRGDGGVVWVNRWVSLLRDLSGQPLRFVAIAEDITARKTAQIALEESETRLQLAREAAGFGIWDRDLVTDLAIWSDQQWRLRGLEPRQEYVDFDVWTSGIHPEDRVRVLQTIEAAIADPAQQFDVTYRIIRQDEETRWLQVKSKVMRDQQGKAVRIVGVTMDVTEAHETEAQLRRLTTDLEARVQEEVAAREAAQIRAAHAERMQALGQLAGGIAHDFNNVLQMVIGASSLIEDEPGDTEQVRTLAHMITEAADRGGATTRRLLTVGRVGDLRAETLNVAGILEGLREIFVHTLGSGIAVELRVEDVLPDIVVDKAQLETVLINLAANARDAMQDGGRLLISAAAESIRAGEIAHHAGLTPGCYVRLCVSDTGSGMDAATLVRVGEPFFTTKKAGAGTGLGVAMAKGFAEQSGGGIDITSHLGRGTVVTLWLPTNAAGRPFLTTKAASRMAMQRHPAGADPLSPSVLLVDDEAAVRQMIAKLLTRSGMQVMVAGDGAEALAILDDGAHADALVTDLSMPGMDGIAVIRAAQERRPGLPAVLLTGYAGDGVALAVSGAIDGSYSLLRKPVTGAQLVDRVRALLAGRAGVER